METTLKNRMDAELKPYLEIQEDRFRRSYECQDDTIMYGMSWNVTQDTMNSIRKKYEIFDEQNKNGGFLNKKSEILCLFDLNGNLVSETIVKGQYGECFIIKDGEKVSFVGLAKKQDTYKKKGYICKVKIREFTCKFTEFSKNKGYPLYKDIVLVNETIIESVKAESSDTWINYLYTNKD